MTDNLATAQRRANRILIGTLMGIHSCRHNKRQDSPRGQAHIRIDRSAIACDHRYVRVSRCRPSGHGFRDGLAQYYYDIEVCARRI
ncbi:hypothetical protein HYQ46_002231 [Verticillium longisporum]|nr:hypothetical protein HYQ46_002231 [Verticillium longisporum]